MFKRVERKRKRREEEEELGLDENAREMIGLNDTDSDETDSDSEQEDAQSNSLGADSSEEKDISEGDAGGESVDEEPSISVAEALKDPIYLVSLDPTMHGCVLCKGKLIKNTGMAAAHRNANAHKRRLEHFQVLSADADPCSNAWELVRTIRSASNMSRERPQGLSKRSLKREVKQAVVREKRKRHKELKAKAIAKVSKKNLAADETEPALLSKANSHGLPESHSRLRKTAKKRKLESKALANTAMRTQGATTKSDALTKSSSGSKKSVLKSRPKSTGKSKQPR